MKQCYALSYVGALVVPLQTLPGTLLAFVLGICLHSLCPAPGTARVLQAGTQTLLPKEAVLCPELLDAEKQHLQFLHGWSPRAAMSDQTHTGQMHQPALGASGNSKATMGNTFQE